MVFSGDSPPGSATAKTELWNGTSWTETTDLNATQSAGSGSGTTSNALSFGGDSPKTATEEWTSPTPTTVSFTVS